MRNEKYRVFVDPSADRKFAGHIEFLARVSESAAIRLYEDYEQALVLLATTPGICPQYTPKRPIDIQLKYTLFGKRYRIVFEIINNEVFVYDIQDCRQDIGKSLV